MKLPNLYDVSGVYDVVMGGLLVLAILIGLYFLGVYLDVIPSIL